MTQTEFLQARIASALWLDYGYSAKYRPWYAPVPEGDEHVNERSARARCFQAAGAVVGALRLMPRESLLEALAGPPGEGPREQDPELPAADVADSLTPIEVWADGSGYTLKTMSVTPGVRDLGPAGAGVVLVDHAHGAALRGFGVPLGKGTNNIAELSAILHGLRGVQATGDVTRPVVVYSDSEYALGAASSRNRASANRELIAELQAEVGRFRKITFQHVKGHSGVTYNELADKLAGRAAKEQRRIDLSEIAFTPAAPRPSA